MDFIRHLLRRNALTHGERTALICGDEAVTHRDLNARVNRIANAFLRQGVVPGKGVVGIFIRNSIEFVAVFFASQKIGLTATPANTRYQADELRHQLDHSGSTVLFFDGDLTEVVSTVRTPGDGRRYICVSRQVPDWAEPLAAFIGQASDDEPPEQPLGANDLATILYTSGTTGVAKGVPVSYRGGLYMGILEANTDMGLTGKDVSLCVAPLFHQGVYGMNLMMPLMVGGCVVIQRRFDADETLRLIERYRVTYAFLVPTMLEAILRSPLLGKCDTSSFAKSMSSGSALPESTKLAIMRAFPGIRLFENYGATESFNSLRLAPEDMLRKQNSAGLPILTQQIRLVDSNGVDVRKGEVGEILVRGPTVLVRYYNPPAGAEKAVDEDGWFHTGDLARQDEEGYFYVVGRSKEMIISGGENIYPREIEDVIASIPGVAECAVAGLPDEYWGEIACAYVVRASSDLASETIETVCAQRLARYKLPKRIVFVDSIPRNSAGKVVRSKLIAARAVAE